MIKIHPPFIAPLASIMTLVLGAGFYTTLTTLDLTERDVDKWIIGCISSSYFSGLLISAFRSQHFILRVGHIRAFAAFATLMCVTSLFQGLFFSPTLWVVLRFLSGYALAGLAVVVESWLMDASDKKDRGAILAVYMFGYYLAQSISQIFLTLEYKQEIEQYILIAIFAALSILPVCMTRFPAPMPAYPNILSFQYLFKRAP
ncbi:MAG TPA: MFS transporter, partial [Gammaproteobacteria bacterium]|nr:MFS transporter [Gammaproteobacteria bacterium]